MKLSRENEKLIRPSYELLGDSLFYEVEESLRDLIDSLSDATKSEYAYKATGLLSTIVTELMFDNEVSVKSRRAGEEFVETWQKRLA